MKHLKLHLQQDLNNQQGWTTMEMLFTFPLLIAALVMAVYFGMLMHTKLTLSNATHAAVQALAKTKDCSIANSFFYNNFPNPGSSPKCTPGDETSEYSAEYTFNDIPLMMVAIPPTKLSSTSKAVTEKQD